MIKKGHRKTVSCRLQMRAKNAAAVTYRRNGLIGRQCSSEGLAAVRTDAIIRNIKALNRSVRGHHVTQNDAPK